MRVLIVGAGPTGSLVAYLLKRCAYSAQISMSVWEKSGGCGGRMATARFSEDKLGPACSVDIGAQYISNVEKYQDSHNRFYEELKASSVLTPMNNAEILGAKEEPTTQHYYCSKGLSSIAKWFMSQSGAELRIKTRLEKIELQADGVLVTSDSGASELYDYVVLTIPLPQVLALAGLYPILEANERSMLEGVSYSSRFALALKLPTDYEIPVTWTATYVTDNPCVRFICIDSRKRSLDKPSTVLVHTSAVYGQQHVEKDKGDRELIDEIMHHTRQLLPWLPDNVQLLRCHKWRYSQVRNAVPGEPGYMRLEGVPKVLICGDAFTHSNLDGCISSALKTVGHLNSFFQSSASN